MTIRFVFNITCSRAPAETSPNEDPGWYVKDRDKIIAYCSTAEEADLVRAQLLEMERVLEKLP